MKSQVINYVLFILYLFTTSIFSQDSLDIENQSQEIIEPKAKILIARHESEFKNAVAEKTKQILEKQNIQVELIGIRLLKEKDSKNYDAIIIINEVRAWHLNFHTRKFFDKIEQTERKKVIMISTAIGIDWETKEEDIDAVTVASEMENVDTLIEDIFKKIIIFLGLD